MTVCKGGELTRLLCGRGQTLPRRTRLCSLSPPGRVDAACMARSWSPDKLALSLYRSNSESAELKKTFLIYRQYIKTLALKDTCKGKKQYDFIDS